jgi:hypothetical protein
MEIRVLRQTAALIAMVLIVAFGLLVFRPPRGPKFPPPGQNPRGLLAADLQPARARLLCRTCRDVIFKRRQRARARDRQDGNRRVRAAMVELAWLWLRWQPDSTERVGKAGDRIKKIMIVALARKLLVALWRYAKDGVIPEGAKMKTV